MSIQVPAHIAVTRFFRRQRERKQAFRDWFDEVYERDWSVSRPKGSGLRDFALGYEDAVAEAGVYDRRVEGDPERLLGRTVKGVEYEGKVLWPLGLGQAFRQPDSAYAEDALLISRVGASVTSKKVTAYEAPLSLCITKHALVRMLERHGIAGDLEDGLRASLPMLLENTSLALALGIVKVVEEGEDWSRTAFIPFAGGLLVVTNRIIVAERHAQDLGWRFNFNRRKYSWGYLKKELLQPIQAPNRVGLGMWFVTTFLSQDQLTNSQIEYEDIFSAFAANAPQRLKDMAFAVQFDPDHLDRPSKTQAALTGIDEEAYTRLRLSVASATFKAHPREGIAFLIEADTSTRAFRLMLNQTP